VQRLLDIQGRGFRLDNLAGMPRRAFQVLGLVDMFVTDEPEPV
jgi:hypothetical protein